MSTYIICIYMYMKCHMGCNKSVKVTGWYTGIGTCVYCVYTIRLQGLVANKKGKGYKGWWPIRRETVTLVGGQ